jgi:hypothetical protein
LEPFVVTAGSLTSSYAVPCFSSAVLFCK